MCKPTIKDQPLETRTRPSK